MSHTRLIKIYIFAALMFFGAPAMALADSVSYTTPGTYTFTVPNYSDISFVVNGGGGGGGSGMYVLSRGSTFWEMAGYAGSPGSYSYITLPGVGTMYGNAGAGGEGGHCCFSSTATLTGAAGTGSGGNASNTTGVGGSGGAYHTAAVGNGFTCALTYESTGETGSWLITRGAPGGAGGQSISTYGPGSLTPGTVLTLRVGSGGSGGPGPNPSGGWGCFTPGPNGNDGLPGSVDITWTPRPNFAPVAPTITGADTSVNFVSNTYSFSSTDPDGDNVQYGVDWDNNSTIDNWYPSAASYLPSGSSYVTSRSWSTGGTYTFMVYARDAGGILSAGTSKTVVVSAPSSSTLSCTGAADTYTTANTYPRIVPASFSTIVVETWGGGGGGGGGNAAQPGFTGGASSFWGSLIASGGQGVGYTTVGGNGGAAVGGDINTTGSKGSNATGGPGGAGGASPNGGTGGTGSTGLPGGTGSAPGGGGAGGGSFFTGSGGGGGGGYAKKTYTPATLPPNTALSVVVGQGGTPGGPGSGFGPPTFGGQGGAGRVKIVCSPLLPTATITSNAPLISGVPTINAGATATFTATYTPASGDGLSTSAIVFTNGVSSVPCTQVTPYSPLCYGQADSTKIYTFSTTTLGTQTIQAGMRTLNFPTYANYASSNITVVSAPTVSLLANGQPNQLTINSGQSATITWAATNVQTGSCRVTNTGNSTVWTGETNNVGQSSGALSIDRTYTLNCNDLSGTPVNPITVGVIVQSPVPTLDSSSLILTPTRVKKGKIVNVGWNVTGLSAGTTCGITPALQGGAVSWDGVGTSWVGSANSTPILAQTIFTLTCVNGISTSVSKTLNLLPEFIEQ